MHSPSAAFRCALLSCALISFGILASAAEWNVPRPELPRIEFPTVVEPDLDLAVLDLPEIEMPVADLNIDKLRSQFQDHRVGHTHHAIDLMKPRGTPVVAVTEGIIRKLYRSRKGGISVYLFDAREKLCFFYGHLDRYVKGLREGMHVKKGEMLGFVGSTGNAKRSAPHLHFAVSQVGPEKKWSGGKAIDPYPLLLQAHAGRVAYHGPRSGTE